MFGVTPASELGIPQGTRLAISVNLACASALWTLENELTNNANENAANEASIIDKKLQEYREELTSRGSL